MISLAVKRVTFKIPKYPKKHALFLIVLRDTYSFRGANELWTFSLPRSFTPRSESSRCGTFTPWNVRSLELSFPPINTARSKSSNKMCRPTCRLRNFRCHVTVKLARSAWAVVIHYTIIRCVQVSIEMDSVNVRFSSPLLLACICYTLWTIIIETSQLNVTKRLPIGLPNIFGFVITQRRVFLRLFVRLGVYRSGVTDR